MAFVYRVLPLCTRERQDASFWTQPMDVCCYLCGENPAEWQRKHPETKAAHVNPHPYPLMADFDPVTREIIVSHVVCRTCMKNAPFWARRLFHDQKLIMWNSELLEEILKERTLLSAQSRALAEVTTPAHRFDDLSTYNDETLEGHTDLLLKPPPLLALKKFGGDLDWLDYNDAKCCWMHPTSNNPHEIRKYAKDDPFYKRDFTGSGICCWGCLQPLGRDGAIPTVYKASAQLLQGLFHPNGRCALRWLLEYDGDTAVVRANASKRLWVRDFNMPLAHMETLTEAPQRMLLEAFGGIFTLERFLEERDVRFVREDWEHTYPYFMRTDEKLTGGLEELQYLDSTTYELQPFDKGLATKITRTWHPVVSSTGHATMWRISLGLSTIEIPQAVVTAQVEVDVSASEDPDSLHDSAVYASTSAIGGGSSSNSCLDDSSWASGSGAVDSRFSASSLLRDIELEDDPHGSSIASSYVSVDAPPCKKRKATTATKQVKKPKTKQV
jgi:hypothetical protein